MILKRIICSLFLLNVLTTIGLGQQIITGRVLDIRTSDPIEGVNIKISNSTIGTISNTKGVFELRVDSLPLEIVVSHIGYTSKLLTIDKSVNEVLDIFITPSTNILDEVVVSAIKERIALSDADQYSLIDFEIVDRKILRIENYGSFKSDKLSLTDLDGQVISTLDLKDFKKAIGLFKSCIGNVYLLTNIKGYQIEISADTILLQKGISIDTVNKFIKPCKIQNEENLYYIFPEYNDQMKKVVKYNTENTVEEILQIIGNAEMIDNYLGDLYLINKGKSIGNILVTSQVESKRIRKLQEESDFLIGTFYKPEYPVDIFLQSGKVLLFNHPESQLLIYGPRGLVEEKLIHYHEDKKWLKQLIHDEQSENIYGLFSHRKGLELKKIIPETGEAAYGEILEVPIFKTKKIKVFDDQIYYLSENHSRHGMDIALFKQKI